MSPKVKVFVYGTLRGTHPHVVRHNDTIRAVAVTLGDYPAVVWVDDLEAPLLFGDVLSMTREELAILDKHEDYLGLYTRQITTTQDGHTVWVYVYNKLLSEWNRHGPTNYQTQASVANNR